MSPCRMIFPPSTHHRHTASQPQAERTQHQTNRSLTFATGNLVSLQPVYDRLVDEAQLAVRRIGDHIVQAGMGEIAASLFVVGADILDAMWCCAKAVSAFYSKLVE